MAKDTLTEELRAAIEAVYRETGSKREACRQTGAAWYTVNRVIGPTAPADPPEGIDYGRLARAMLAAQGQPVNEGPPPCGASLIPGPEPTAPQPPAGVANPDALLARLRKAPMTLGEVAGAGKTDEATAAAWLAGQRGSGINVQSFDDKWVIERTPPRVHGPAIEIVSDEDDSFTLGAMGDTHLCSKYERLDVLNDLYDRYEAEGVAHVFHAGNWIDGEAPFNRYDLNTHGMDAQIRYLAREYPRRAGVHTYAVAGDDHEGWYCQKSGVNIGWYAEAAMRKAGRSDWSDLGYMEAFVRLVNRRSGQASTLAVVHPGGGSAYALSYTVQKIVESYAGGEKPAVLFAGHYHKMELANIRNVWTVQTGCTQDQTPFMRKKRLEAHVGGHVIRLRQDPRTGAIVEMNGMLRYFNSGYYNNRWSHAGDVNLPARTQGGV